MILLDSDVLLDVALNRKLFISHSAAILSLGYNNQIDIGVTPIILSNVYYLISSNSSDLVASTFISNTLKLTKFLPILKEDFSNALNSSFKDKEDAINYYTAIRSGCSSIITRNINDFKYSKILVLTPSEFLTRL